MLKVESNELQPFFFFCKKASSFAIRELCFKFILTLVLFHTDIYFKYIMILLCTVKEISLVSPGYYAGMIREGEGIARSEIGDYVKRFRK